MNTFRISRYLGLTLAAAACFAIPTFAAQDAGTESALYIGAEARTMALGRAGVTEYESAFTAEWNPAGLGYIPRFAVGLQMVSLFGEAWHKSIGVVYPTLDWGTFSLSIMRLELDDIERRTGHNLPDGTFEMIEQHLAIAYGYRLLGPFSLGVNVKVHDLHLDNRVSTAPGMDAGIFVKLPRPFPQTPADKLFRDISLGLAFRNLVGPIIRLNRESEQMHPNWRFGCSANLDPAFDFLDHLLVRFEVEKPERADLRWHGGLEGKFYNLFSIRGGWDHEYLSAGAGLRYADIALDYAVSFPALGLRHIVTLTIDIGADVESLRQQRAAEEERKRLAIVENLKSNITSEHRQKAVALMASQDYSPAAKLWEKILDWEPDNAEARAQFKKCRDIFNQMENQKSLESARKYFKAKRYIDVMVECRTVMERDPNNSEAQRLIKQAELKAGDLNPQASILNEQMIKRMQKEFRLGLKSYTGRNWKNAIAHWEKVIENTPLQKQVYAYLRNARARLSESEKQADKSSRQMQIDKKRRELHKKAVELSKQGKLKDAAHSWEKLMKENPEDQEVQRSYEKTRQDIIDSQKKGIRW